MTVSANSLNVRSGPGTDFDVIDSVKKGDQVIGLREDSGWVQVELPAGTTSTSEQQAAATKEGE